MIDLMKELSNVRKNVASEYQLLNRTGLLNTDSLHPSQALEYRKRLMYLFLKDLSNGLSGDILLDKSHRDASLSAKSRELNGISLYWKVIGWMVIFLMNFGMLFYVYLFAMNQTQSRQASWFWSFVIWIFFEIFVSSTALVCVVHILIPLYVMTDVSKTKEKVLLSLSSFRKKYLRRGDDENGKEDGVTTFNAAKFLFVSWRVASLMPERPESELILQYHTLWPTQRFAESKSELAREYDQDVIITAASRILLYFITSLLQFHTLVQDILVQLLCNSGFASLCLLLTSLWRIHPAIPLSILLALFLLLAFSLRWLSSRNSDLGNKLKALSAAALPKSENDKTVPISPQSFVPTSQLQLISLPDDPFEVDFFESANDSESGDSPSDCSFPSAGSSISSDISVDVVHVNEKMRICFRIQSLSESMSDSV